jgi:broad specificity phosphatase PhoE
MTTPENENVPQTVFLIRHGLSGGEDVPLSDRGILQAEQARNVLLAQSIGSSAIILSSPLPRAAETARIIGNGLGAEVELVEELSDLHSAHKEAPDVNEFVRDLIASRIRAKDIKDERPVVVVGHAPLIGALTQNSQIANGQVISHSLREATPTAEDVPEEPKKRPGLFRRRKLR